MGYYGELPIGFSLSINSILNSIVKICKIVRQNSILSISLWWKKPVVQETKLVQYQHWSEVGGKGALHIDVIFQKNLRCFSNFS